MVKEEVYEYIKGKRNYFSERLEEVGLFKSVTYLILGGSRPASIGHHHAYDGGLIEHTYEVMKICEQIASIKNFSHYETDDLLFLALVHDLGKVHEYEFDQEKGWVKTEFKDHIRYGYYKLYDSQRMNAKRLAAHHGRIEWGALFEPFDKISWALHLADMISAKCE